MQGKEDPLLKIGSTNDRSQKADSDYVWALKDINFEVQQGDVLGIIGRNGAGKSTLLKILSKTTAPTTGSVKVKGRIASLLEVGTGFHPELTGRENIYLNGAILGMRKHEITRKLDEIIDFAGVERYIDTPVKRYSSGMYVRLAFGVAAHLESEILIIDEVLAVGDAEFQKKCLGKMGDVAKGEGRTVLFVSHNLGAISNICKRGIFIKNGNILEDTNINNAISAYINETLVKKKSIDFTDNNGLIGDGIKIKSAAILNENEFIYNSDEIRIGFLFKQKYFKPFYLILIIRTSTDLILFEHVLNIENYNIEDHNIEFVLPQSLFNEGNYTVQINFHRKNTDLIGYSRDLLSFEVLLDRNKYSNSTSGYMKPEIRHIFH
jgi:lipopolysaccharide transport system ATP-binding protein